MYLSFFTFSIIHQLYFFFRCITFFIIKFLKIKYKKFIKKKRTTLYQKKKKIFLIKLIILI